MILPFPNVEGDPLFKEINLFAFQKTEREGKGRERKGRE